MIRTPRCSQCKHNGHNSRTCPTRGAKLFGVRLTQGSISKSASMSNLSRYSGPRLGGRNGTGSNNPVSPRDGDDHRGGYASEDFVIGSSSSSRGKKKGTPWKEEEHRMFLLGLQKLGKSNWRGISKNYVKTRTPTQIASHAQKYFIRQSNVSRRKRRFSLFDMVPNEVTDVLMESQEIQEENIDALETQMQGSKPLILETEECESVNSTKSNTDEQPPEETTTPQLQTFPMLYPTYFSAVGYVNEPPIKEETHEILRPMASHWKVAPINVNQLLGMSKRSLEDSSQNNGLSSLKLVGDSSSRQSAFHLYPASGGSHMKIVVHDV